MYEIFEKLCVENNVTPYRVSKETGVTTATLTAWKQGKYEPKKDKLQKLADYFDVSLSYLMTGKEPQADYLYTDENADFLIEVTRKAKNKDFVEMMKKYMELMDTDKKSVDDMIDFLHAKKKGEA